MTGEAAGGVGVLLRAWRATWKIGVFLLVWALLYAPLVLLVDPGSAVGDGGLPVRTRLALELTGAVAILGAAWGVLRWLDRRPFSSLGLRFPGALGGFAHGVAIGGGMIGAVLLSAGVVGWVDWVRPTGFSWTTLAVLAMAIFLNTIIQEVMVRGYALQTVESEFGVRSALVVSTVLFAALHGGAISEGGALPGINLTAAGLLLGLVYIRTRSLWPAIGLHFSWNFLQGPVLGIAVTGQTLGGRWRMLEPTGPDLWTGGAFGLEGGLLATAATLGATAYVGAGTARRGEPNSPGVTPAGSEGEE